MATLRIENLHAEVEGKEILKGINLTFSSNETVALLGPNGHGKSTLLNVLMGHPKYVVTQGTVTLDGVNILELPTDQRAKLGLFLAMQNPPEVPGVNNADFFKSFNRQRDRHLAGERHIITVSSDIGLKFAGNIFNGLNRESQTSCFSFNLGFFYTFILLISSGKRYVL